MRREPRPIISFLIRLLFAVYFLETGLVLVVLPWSSFWDKNVFMGASPLLERVLSTSYARGAVSGVGVVTALAGVAELAAALSARRARLRNEAGPGA